MSSNATETVIRARELMDSGVDPIVLMSQLATLIVDIIAGTYPSADGKYGSFFGGRNCKCHSDLIFFFLTYSRILYKLMYVCEIQVTVSHIQQYKNVVTLDIVPVLCLDKKDSYNNM